MTLAAPMDTGIWEMRCNESVPDFGNWSVVCQGPELQGWAVNGAHPVSTAALGHFDHMLVAHASFWNSSAANVPKHTTHAARNIARLLARLVDDKPYAVGLPLTVSEVRSMYYEANIAGAAFYKDRAVKAIVASFRHLYGTAAGRQLQEICTKRNLVLFWCHTQWFDRTYVMPSTTSAVNQRLVDPLIAAATTANASAAVLGATAVFDAAWTEAASGVPAPNSTNPFPNMGAAFANKLWSRLWNGTSSELRFAPLRARSCAAVDRCVGVTPGGECLCYNTNSTRG
jgi:hypothetical protein